MTKILLLIIIVAAGFWVFRKRGEAQKVALENRRAGMSFLEQNQAKDEVETTASGLQYQVLQEGDGNTRPTATDTVKVHYHGTLIDGTVFDSSVSRGEPVSFPLNQVIKGWTEGLQLMTVGEKTRFFIPPDLGYGDRSMGNISPGSVLIFDVELLGINE